MTKRRQKSHVPAILATAGVLSGIGSGVLYEYHSTVVFYRPNDVSDTLGLYLMLASIVFWVAYLIVRGVRYLRYASQEKTTTGR